MILLDQNKAHKLPEDELNRVAGDSVGKIISKYDLQSYYLGFIQRIEIEPHVANSGYDVYYTALFDKTISTGCDTPQEAIIDLAFKLDIELYTKE